MHEHFNPTAPIDVSTIAEITHRATTATPASPEPFPKHSSLCLDGQIIRLSQHAVSGGGYADIWTGQFRNRMVAIKIMRPFSRIGVPLEKAKILKRIWREYFVWSRLSHPNILQCLGFSYDFTSQSEYEVPSLISHWMNNGTVLSYIDNHPSADRLQLLMGIGAGLYHLHTQQPVIVHGDLRGANVLVSDAGVPCLTDFGLSRTLTSTVGLTPSTDFGGSVRWMSPELLHEDKASQTSDVWAYGMTVLEICTGRHPFTEFNLEPVVLCKIIGGQVPSRPMYDRALTDELWSLCRRCWEPQSIRPSMRQVMAELKLFSRGHHSTYFSHPEQVLDISRDVVSSAYQLSGFNPSCPTTSRYALDSRHTVTSNSKHERWSIEPAFFNKGWESRHNIAVASVPVSSPNIAWETPLDQKNAIVSHKGMLLTDPNSLIGYCIADGQFKLMSVLGILGDGVVYRAVECCPADITHCAPPRQFSVKAVSKFGLEARQRRYLEHELKLQARVSNHPHIVSLHGVVEDDEVLFVFRNYFSDGDMFEMIMVHRAYIGNHVLIKSVFLQLIDAVEHIHGLGVAHRNIKPENILCQDGGSHISLGNFRLGTDSEVVRDYGIGSEPYMAPECFGGFWEDLGPYSATHTDIWALGVVLVNLTCARNPWNKATEESVIYQSFLSKPDYLMKILPASRELNDILKRIFVFNPQARIHLQELRDKVKAVESFTLTDEELGMANPTAKKAMRDLVHQRKAGGERPGACRITNLTIQDIVRLECEAPADTSEMALQHGEDINLPNDRVMYLDADPTLASLPLLFLLPDGDSDADWDDPRTPEILPSAADNVEISRAQEIDFDDLERRLQAINQEKFQGWRWG